MNTTTVITSAITGAVGIAGVTGTIVSARIARRSATENLKLSISAENERADKAEKRRIYAACLAGFTNLLETIAEALGVLKRLETSEDDTSKDDIAAYKDVGERYKTELKATIALIQEANLIGPPRVRELLEEARHELMRVLPAIHQGNVTYNDWLNKAASVYAALFDAMCENLGEPVGPVEE